MTTEEPVSPDLVLDLVSFQLVRGGQRLKLEKSPLELLSLLASRRGALVTREEIVEKLWGDTVHVDVDAGINTAVRKIRQILDDNPISPRYLETVIGKGYRFIGPIRVIESHRESVAPGLPNPLRPASRAMRTMLAVGLAFAFSLTLAAIVYTMRVHSRKPEAPISIAIVPLKDLSETQGQDFFVDGLTEEIITQLGQLSPQRIRVVTYRSSAGQRSPAIAALRSQPELQYLLEGSVRRLGERARISVRLIRVADSAAIWTESFDREIGDVLGLQAEIAQRIGEELKVTVTPQISEQPQPSEMVEMYFRGRFELQRRPVPHSGRSPSRFRACHRTRAFVCAGVCRFG